MTPVALTRRRLLASGLGLAALPAIGPAGLPGPNAAAAAALLVGPGGHRRAAVHRRLAAWEGPEEAGTIGGRPAPGRPGAGAGPSGAPTPPPHPALPEGARPFAPGEQLRYEVDWSGIGAGEATLEVVGPAGIGGQSGLLVRFVAESNRFVSFFYRLHDRHESLLDPLFLFSRRYEAWIEQGRRRRHRVVVFEPEAGRLTRTEASSGEAATLPLDGPAVDGLGLLYHLRARALEPGSRLAVPIYRKQEVRLVTIEAIGPVVTETPAGRFETVELRPVDEAENGGRNGDANGGGFFGGASLRIWLTTDRRRLPVRLAGSARRGSIDARLAEVRIPPVAVRR